MVHPGTLDSEAATDYAPAWRAGANGGLVSAPDPCGLQLVDPFARNTVAKNLSSSAPMRFRSTPMNHRNAMPASGTRFRAKRTAFTPLALLSHIPAFAGSAGTATRTSPRLVSIRTEKITPATAAARGGSRVPWDACG